MDNSPLLNSMIESIKAQAEKPMDAYEESIRMVDIPAGTMEDWKYTPLKNLVNQKFVVPQRPNLAVTENISDILPSNAKHALVFIDGFYQKDISRVDALPKDIEIKPMKAMSGEELHPYFAKTMDPNKSTFYVLNHGILNQGIFFKCPKGVVIKDPIYFLFLTSTKDLAIQPRNIITIGRDSEISFVEHYYGKTTYLTNQITEFMIDENAAVTHYKWLDEGDDAFHMGLTGALLKKNSRFYSHSLALNGGWIRSDTEVKFTGEGAECELNGVYVLDKQQHVEHHTHVEHKVPHCKSDEMYKGFVGDSARVVFDGKAHVKQGAQKTDASQATHTVLLSEKARADTKPEMIIYADDVKCAHGATVGQLDKDLLFYLQSRGLNKDTALEFLLFAYVSEVLDRIRDDSIKNQVREMVSSKLRGGA